MAWGKRHKENNNEDVLCWINSKGDSFALAEEKSIPTIDTKRLESGVISIWTTQSANRYSVEPIYKKIVVQTELEEVTPLINQIKKLYLDSSQNSSEQISDKIFEIKFKLLSEKWKSESKYISLVKKSFKLESYQQIIKMGSKAIPFLLRELAESQDYWFEALKEITGERNVIRKENYHDFSKMTEDWLEWGRRNGYYLL